MRRFAFDWDEDVSEENRGKQKRLREKEAEGKAKEKESKLLDAVDVLKSALAEYFDKGGIDAGLLDKVDGTKTDVRNGIMSGYIAGGEDSDGSGLRKVLHAASAAYKLAGYLSNSQIDVGALRALDDKLSNGDYSGLKKNIAEVSKNIISNSVNLDSALRLTDESSVAKWVNDVSNVFPGAEDTGSFYGGIHLKLEDESRERENLLAALRKCSAAL